MQYGDNLKILIFTILLFILVGVGFAKDTETESGPYDPNANIDQKIEQALQQAQKNEQHILLVFGANWCPWCRALHDLMENNKKVNNYLDEHYQVVLIDVGRKDNNMDFNQKYGNPIKLGLPALVVLDEKGKRLVVQETASLETNDTEEKGHDVTKVLNFLKKYRYHSADKKIAGLRRKSDVWRHYARG